jgi:membrane protein DedA with SNARE-associated domain
MPDVDGLLLWISNHPQWAELTVMLVAFLESLAIISLFVPGWLLLVGVGAIIGSGNLNFYDIAIAGFIGAFVGESLSYFIGWRYRKQVPQWRWFQQHPEWLAKSHNFFQKHGASSVALGRFFGPVRAFVPMVAGISEMPPMRFIFINFISALVWAPVYLLPGVVAGAAIEVDKQIGAAIIISIIGLIVFSWLAIKEIREFFRQKSNGEKFLQIAKIPIPLLKAIISTICFIVIFKLLFFGSLQPNLEALFERVVTVIGH